MGFARPVKAGFLSWVSKIFSGETPISPLETSAAASISLPLIGRNPLTGYLNGTGGPESLAEPNLLSIQESALVGLHNPMGILPPGFQDRIIVYTVKTGDTPSYIAEKFGISVNTLLWANNLNNPNLIEAGDELIILPITGVQYVVKRGDTIEAIAKKFKGDATEILRFNGLAVGEPLSVGLALIIPDGEMEPPLRLSPPSVSRFAGLPEVKGYYLRPVLGGRRSRGLHGLNGVDLAISCGSPVFAAAEGEVIVARSSGWNGGYGRYMVISHPNGTQTLYAHLSSVLAKVGQHVSRGSQIATVGSTGNSTGCHVHFEVRGAKNPF